MVNGENDKVVQVLQLVVQHCTQLSPPTICTLLQLSTACRKALQGSVGHVELVIDGDGLSYLTRLTSFATWLPKNGSQVARITLSSCSMDIRPVAQQLVALALHSCATAMPVGALATYDSSRPLGLQLRALTVHWSMLSAPALLGSLAAFSSLTYLKVGSPDDNASALHGALGRLSSLQELHWKVCRTWPASVLHTSFSAAVQQLSRLTHLNVAGRFPDTAVHQLPASLKLLQLSLPNRGAPAPVDLDLSHLSCLQQLYIYTGCHRRGGISAASVLPASLTRVTCLGSIETVSGLQELQHLSFKSLQSVPPCLQHAPQALPKLQCLEVLSIQSHDVFQELFPAIGRITNLTCLALQKPVWSRKTIDLCGAQLHKCLLQLTGLQTLSLDGMGIQPADALHFTALTTLTYLAMVDCKEVGDMAVAAMACKLTGLRCLVLNGCGLKSPLLWPALACLTNLKRLGLIEAALKFDDQAMQLLQCLSQLTSLTLDSESNDLSLAALGRFNASHCHLQEV